MEDKEIFAKRLKEIRTQTGKTQKDFAEMVGSTAASISAYENSTKNPSLKAIRSIAEKCNISMDWLCGLTKNKRETIEFNNYKDVASIILKLIKIDVMMLYERPVMIPSPFSPKTLCCELKTNIKELNDFFQTYMDLVNLEREGKVKQNVIDAWLLTALEELATSPICTEIPCDEPPEPPQD